MNNTIFLNFSLKHKFGLPDKNVRFILEYGAQFNIFIPFKQLIRANNDDEILGDLYIGSGPKIFLGLEHYKDKLSIEWGMYMGCGFGGQSFFNHTFDSRGQSIHALLGLEVRFNYIVFKNYYYKKIGNLNKKEAKSKVINEKKELEIINNEDLVEENKQEKTNMEKMKDAQIGEVIIFSDIIFYPDSAKIEKESFKILDKIVRILLDERKGINIQIIGYTNDTGNPVKELMLSIKRATSVADYLISKGISAKRIIASGHGSLETKENEITDANRRVEIKITGFDE